MNQTDKASALHNLLDSIQSDALSAIRERIEKLPEDQRKKAEQALSEANLKEKSDEAKKRLIERLQSIDPHAMIMAGLQKMRESVAGGKFAEKLEEIRKKSEEVAAKQSEKTTEPKAE